MKKLLICLFVTVCGLSSFATREMAPWNAILHVPFKARVVKPLLYFTDPYVTNCGAYIISPNYPPNYAVQIQVTFDQAVLVPYYAVISVTGVWDSQPGGASEKYFTVLFPTGWQYKSQNFHLNSTEEVYTENTYCSDYGAQ